MCHDITTVTGLLGLIVYPYIQTSHASIAYRKQPPPQRTVGTIGSVWGIGARAAVARYILRKA